MSSKVYLATKNDLGALQTTGVGIGEVGVVTWQYTLLANHLKLDGTTVLGAEYPLLLAFAVDHELVTTDVDNKVLFKYDETTDVLTLPDLIGLCVQGGADVTQMVAGLPNITGAMYSNLGYRFNGVSQNALYLISTEYSSNKDVSGVGSTSVNTGYPNVGFDASKSNAIYGNSSTVQPPAIKLIPQIRYAADAATSLMDMVGHVLYDVVLRDGFIKANGASVALASTSVPRLVAFVREHTELLGDGPALYKYAEAEDTLTLPNFTARVLQGGDSVATVSAGLPNATGYLQIPISYQPGTYDTKDNLGANGVFNGSYVHFYNAANRQTMMINWTGGTITNDRFVNAGATFSLKSSNSIYGASSTVQPPAITLIPQIKY